MCNTKYKTNLVMFILIKSHERAMVKWILADLENIYYSLIANYPVFIMDSVTRWLKYYFKNKLKADLIKKILKTTTVTKKK